MKLNKDLNSRIASFMQEYMRTHGLAQGTLSKKLGYKSVTSIVRLLKGRVAYVAVADCLKRFSSLPMTENESIEYNKLISQNLMLIKHGQWISIINESAIDPEGCIHLNDRIETVTLHLQDARQLKIRMFGCIVPSMTAEMIRLLNKGAEVKHFLRIDDNGRSVTQILDACLPLHFSSNYTAFLYDAGKNEIIAGLTGDDIALCSYLDAAGDPHREMIVMTDATHGVTIKLDPHTDIDYIADKASHRRKTISFSNYHQEDYGKDLIAYTDYCSRLEKDVPARHIKPDIGIDQIPVDILRAAIRSDLPPEVQNMLPALMKMMYERWENNCRSSCPKHYVLKRSAMKRFMETGLLYDHIWLLRPFTMNERREILAQILHQQTQNPNCHIYFLKDDTLLNDREVVLYGRTGLCFLRSDVSYTLKDELPEILICRKHVMDSFTAFYDEALLGTCTLSEDETTTELLNLYGQFSSEASNEPKA